MTDIDTPEEVAHTLVYLVSDESAYEGAELVPDRGTTAWARPRR